MSAEFIWQLPARGDGRYGDAAVRRRGERSTPEPSPLGPGLSDPRGVRFNYFDHLHQIARAAELSGFDGVQIQHDPEGDESWIIAGYLVRGTRRLKLVTEFEASWGSSVYAAKNAATLQRYSRGRLAWHLQAGAASKQRQKNADPVPDEGVLPRIGEFLQVARGVLSEAPFSFQGRFFAVQNGGFKDGLDHQPVPQVYLSGTSRAALELAAQYADVHVLPPRPLVELRQTIAALERLAGSLKRSLRYGLRLDLLARETDGEALLDARRLRGQIVGSSATATIEGPGLWNGPLSTRTGAEAALIGSYGRVAEKLSEYQEAGISNFVLGAIPHLEEAYRIGAHVLPLLRQRHRPASTTSSIELGGRS
ncbi:MAG: LLM class flavin-dependent oxidoreductase [Polyangia bacterium]